MGGMCLAGGDNRVNFEIPGIDVKRFIDGKQYGHERMEIFIEILLFLLTMLPVVFWLLFIMEDRGAKSIFQDIGKGVCDSSHFNVKAYLDRIERESLAIEQENERHKQESSTIILWLCLDGLRLNKDGTTTWIRRDENNVIKTCSNSSCLHCDNTIGRNLDGTLIKNDPDLCSTCCTSQKKFDSEQRIDITDDIIDYFSDIEKLKDLYGDDNELMFKAFEIVHNARTIKRLENCTKPAYSTSNPFNCSKSQMEEIKRRQSLDSINVSPDKFSQGLYGIENTVQQKE